MAIRASSEVTIFDQTDADALVTWYQLTSSATKPSKPSTTIATDTPPGWTKAEPAFSEGSTKYLYTCLQTVWKNGKCDWGDVQLDSGYEAAKVAYNQAVTAKAASDFLRYDHTFTKDEGTYSFEATLMRGSQDVTSTVPQDRFVWWLRNESGERFWSRGPSLEISEDEAGYRGSVIGGYEDEENFPDLALGSSDGLTFVTASGDRIVARVAIGEMNG